MAVAVGIAAAAVLTGNYVEILSAAATNAFAHCGVLDNSTVCTIFPFAR
jgi:hypothetical protein